MKKPPRDVVDRASRIRLVLLDSDGVLTDGRLLMGRGGHDGRAFHTRDGLGIRLGQRAGLHFGIVSGRQCAVVEERGRELSIDEIHQGVGDKLGRVKEILRRLEIGADATCFVGDDLPDIPAMRHVALGAAPADAAVEVRESAHWVTTADGGRGAIREVIDLLLQASGQWTHVTRAYFEPEQS